MADLNTGLMFNCSKFNLWITMIVIVLRPTRESLMIRARSPLQANGCKILKALINAWHAELYSREGSLSCHTCCNTGPQFFWSQKHLSDMS
jgi:hypothetical protein